MKRKIIIYALLGICLLILGYNIFSIKSFSSLVGQKNYKILSIGKVIMGESNQPYERYETSDQKTIQEIVAYLNTLKLQKSLRKTLVFRGNGVTSFYISLITANNELISVNTTSNNYVDIVTKRYKIQGELLDINYLNNLYARLSNSQNNDDKLIYSGETENWKATFTSYEKDGIFIRKQK